MGANNAQIIVHNSIFMIVIYYNNVSALITAIIRYLKHLEEKYYCTNIRSRIK
jgi:hypothetical protein